MTAGDRVTVIMVVDDEPENLEVLGRMLRFRGCRLALFPSGESALRAAAAQPPDLVLLDILMPGLDGFEVCRRMKADARLRDIPVLFLSALSGVQDKVDAFAAGGVDYITKPLSEAEVVARVDTHLALRRHQLLLEERVRARTAELTEANRRLKVWDEATHDWLMMLSHELRTPLTVILGITDHLFAESGRDSPAAGLRTGFDAHRARIEELIQAAEIIGDLGTLAGRFTPAPCAVMPLIRAAAAAVAASGRAGVHPDSEGCGAARVPGDPALLLRAIRDLLLTAACCVRGDGPITVDAGHDDGIVWISIRTGGPHLSAPALDSFFHVGGQRDLIAPGGDYGLRPAVAWRIAQLFGGTASVRNLDPAGIEIRMELPLLDEAPGDNARPGHRPEECTS